MPPEPSAHVATMVKTPSLRNEVWHYSWSRTWSWRTAVPSRSRANLEAERPSLCGYRAQGAEHQGPLIVGFGIELSGRGSAGTSA